MEASGPITDIVVFASGRGSNFRAICEGARTGKLPVRVQALVANVRGAGACEIAREFRVPVLVLESRGRARDAHEASVLEALSRVPHRWIVLAGYMRLFTADFVARYWDNDLGCARMINIHPSLLPSFPGKDGYAQAIRHGVKMTGATVHLVGSGLDDGPIVEQAALEVFDDDTETTLSARGLLLEHELYVRALAKLFAASWKVGPGADPQGRPRVIFENKNGRSAR